MNLWLELVPHWHRRRTMKQLLMFEIDERLLRVSMDDVPRRKLVHRQLQPRLLDWLANSPLGVSYALIIDAIWCRRSWRPLYI